MKKLLIICLALVTFLGACAASMYGVPQETWDRMSESERIEAMHVYEREQQARRQAAEERARRQAFERERERVRQAEIERARRERIEAIHRGEGAYGELIRVRLQGGRIKVGDRHHRYEPVTFTIADGETRRIGVADNRGRQVDLVVTYAEGSLALDGIRFPYERRWGRGMLYADTGTSGPLALRGVDVFIEVRNHSSRHERDLPRLVIIMEESPPVVIREQEPRRQPQVIRDEKPKPPPVPVREPPKSPPPVVREPIRQQPVAVREPTRQPPAPTVVVEGPPRTVEVALLSGEMKVRGRNQQVERIAVRLSEGESRNLSVKSGGETRTIPLRYAKGGLSIDSGSARKGDAVRLPFEKEWKSGKVYRLSLKGRTALENVEMKVTGVPGN